MRHDALTYTMMHYKAVYELNLHELTVKINLRHCSRVIHLYVQL